MHGSANSNIFETVSKSVTSPSDEKRKQTVATLVAYLTISDMFLGKYLIRVLMN